MNVEYVYSIKVEELELIRAQLNNEIEKCGFDLSDPKILKISQELDTLVVLEMKKNLYGETSTTK